MGGLISHMTLARKFHSRFVADRRSHGQGTCAGVDRKTDRSDHVYDYICILEKSVATISEVAKRAGVSVATISRVLNNSPLVTDATKERIRKIIEELDYHPNVVARSLRSSKSRLLLALVPNNSNPFHAEIVHGTNRVVHAHDYTWTWPACIEPTKSVPPLLSWRPSAIWRGLSTRLQTSMEKPGGSLICSNGRSAANNAPENSARRAVRQRCRAIMRVPPRFPAFWRFDRSRSDSFADKARQTQQTKR